MAKEIYNKNAREKVFLEEAYSQVYQESILDKIRGKKEAVAPPQEAAPQEAESMGSRMQKEKEAREAKQGKEGGARHESSPHLYNEPDMTADWNTPGTEDYEIAQEYFGTHPDSAEDMQHGYRPPLKGQEDRFQPGGDLHGDDPTHVGEKIDNARKQNEQYKDVPGKENLVRPGMEEDVVSRDVIEGHDTDSSQHTGYEYQMKNNPEYAAAQRRMADSPHKRGPTQKESTMRAKDELQHLVEAYAQVNEGHSGPVPGWEKQAGLEKELEANRKAARRDPHRHVGAEDRRRAPSEVWKSMPPGERDKLGKKSEDAETWYGPGDDPADMPPGATWDAEWENSDALADILHSDLTDLWRTGEYSDTDKESLKTYINKFIDQELGDGQIDDGDQGGDAPPLGRAAALRKEPGTNKDKLFYK